MIVFVDTNVLVDLVCSRSPYLEDAKEIFALAYEKRISLVISSLSYINAFYIGKRYSFSSEQLITTLLRIETFSDIAAINHDIIVQALNSGWKDVEDATQYYSAVNVNADVIVTRNAKDFSSSKISILSPKNFLEHLTASLL
jgi:predicted nucleic acid-binding protein